MRRLAAALFVVASGMPAATKATAQNVAVENSSSMSRADIDRVFEIFKRNCSPLNRYWSDIQTVRIDVGEEFAPHRLARGWKFGINVQVVIPREPKVIPAADGRAGVLAGHCQLRGLYPERSGWANLG